jgi:cytochrome c oxidase assembly factor CtaG
MVQHLLLVFGVAPALALGAPLRHWPVRAPVADPVPSGRLVALGTAWLIVTLYVTHLPVVYDRALELPVLHVVEHSAYLLAGLAFWAPVVAVDPLPIRASHGQRLVAVAATGPFTGLLAAAIATADRPIYPAQRTDLADQRAGASIMWITHMLVVAVALIALALDWSHEEEHHQPHPGDVSVS